MNKRSLVEGLIGIGMGLGGLLFLGIIFLGELDLASAEAAKPTPIPPTPTPIEPIALWEAQAQAYAVAQAQAADVQFVSASAQWPAASEEALLAGIDNWAFTFYSPSQSQVLDVVVGTEKAWVVNQSQVWVTPNILTGSKWQEGPRDALLVFLAQGGRDYLQAHPKAVVDLHLAAGEGSGGIWSILTLDVTDRSEVSIQIDGETWQVLSQGS
jgi:hypothetical protein